MYGCLFVIGMCCIEHLEVRRVHSRGSAVFFVTAEVFVVEPPFDSSAAKLHSQARPTKRPKRRNGLNRLGAPVHRQPLKLGDGWLRIQILSGSWSCLLSLGRNSAEILNAHDLAACVHHSA